MKNITAYTNEATRSAYVHIHTHYTHSCRQQRMVNVRKLLAWAFRAPQAIPQEDAAAMNQIRGAINKKNVANSGCEES